MSDLGRLLGEIYRPAYEHHFRDHPDKDRIVEALVSGDVAPELVDLWFSEASGYSWKKLNDAVAKMPVSEDGTVVFQVFREDRDE